MHLPEISYLYRMQNRSTFAMFTMSGILLLFATFASLLPDVLESNSSVIINVKKEKVIDYLSAANNWGVWMFDRSDKDDSWRTLTSGEIKGVGSTVKWFSSVIGDGGLEIKKISDEIIIFERITDNNAYRDRGYLTFKEIAEGIEVKWLDSLDISTSFMARFHAQDENYINKIDSVNTEMLLNLKFELEQ